MISAKHFYSVTGIAILGTLIMGVGGRGVMRVIAILGGVNTGGSLGGSLEVVAFGGLVGLATGIVYQFIKTHLPGNPILQGVMVGGLIYITLLLLPIDSKNAARGFPQLTLVVHALFGGLSILFGVAIAYFQRRIS